MWVIFIAGVAADPPQTIKPDRLSIQVWKRWHPRKVQERVVNYLNSNFFLITCNTSFSTPKPQLLNWNVEVLNISLKGHLTISTYVAVDCYSETGKLEIEQLILPYYYTIPFLGYP